MQIDDLSKNIIRLALYLDQKIPGMVAEIWIGKELIAEFRNQILDNDQAHILIQTTKTQINNLKDNRRKTYLSTILNSLEFQIQTLGDEIHYSDFCEKVFGFRIPRVTTAELNNIEGVLCRLEKKTHTNRFEVFKQFAVPTKQYINVFKDNVLLIKTSLPKYITDYEDRGFLFEITNHKPWSAFNTHIAPFQSKLTLNTDIVFNQMELRELASHESYAGHHSELSQKDKLLINEGRGEHGLVITYSPQTFVSEAIAEGMYVLLDLLDEQNVAQMLAWYYDSLICALQNMATFMFFDEKFTRQKIAEMLKYFGISDETREYVLNFSTDPLFGKYAAVYYTAFNFLQRLYNKTSHKEKLIRTLFTKPCTPKLLVSEFVYMKSSLC
jgi:hypothetical protein